MKNKTKKPPWFRLMFSSMCFIRLKIPTGVVEPLGPCERQAESTSCTCSDSDDVCRWFTDSPTRCSVSRPRVVRLAIHVYPNISGTYVHNLQRTTPTAFSRFSCVTARAVCPFSLAHRAHRYPEDEQERQLARAATRGQW